MIRFFSRRMSKLSRFSLIAAILLCLTLMMPIAASAASYYTSYRTVAALGNANDCYSTQGLGVGSTYVYSIKVNDDKTKAVIYRTKMSDGSTTLMSNGDDGTTYATYLGGANDVALHSNDGNYYMFVVTLNSGSMSLVKLQYDGTTYYKVGNYTIQYNGSAMAMSGVKITGTDANNIYFLFKSGENFYKGSLPLTATSGTINVTYGFNLNIADALVNGSTVSDIGTYLTQGFGYYNNSIYFPLTKDNVSIVLVYRNISAASGTVYADDDLSFRITSSTYPDLFEIEGVGIANGDKLWFNTNRRTATGDTASDGVHYFTSYHAQYFNTYSNVATLDNANDCYSTQGFGVGTTYVYSIKVNDDDTKAVIYRTKMSDGSTTLMSNGDDGTTYATYLNHANDVALHSNDGNYYMFVITANSGSMSLVKLQYDGTTYYKVGNYTIQYNGSGTAMSGVKITGKDANNIYFLFKSGENFYKGSLPLTATSGTINVTYGFNLNIADALVNGSTVSDIGTYLTQGFGYYNNSIYFPLTKDNVSIVLVYRNISTASGTVYADDNLSFRITSNTYPDLFEIEGVGIANGDKLWFNTNRRMATGDTASDGVHYFNYYSGS